MRTSAPEHDWTKDILHVRQPLGHKEIENILSKCSSSTPSTKCGRICPLSSKDRPGNRQLIELGLEYVTGEYGEGGKLFKEKKLSYLDTQSPEGL